MTEPEFDDLVSDDDDKNMQTNGNSDDENSDEDAPMTEAELEQQNKFLAAVSQEQVDILQQKLANNPYDYDTHVQLIAVLRARLDGPALRAARELLVQHLAVTEEIWAHWIQDEEDNAKSEQDFQFITGLYKRAVQEAQCMF